MSVLNKRNIKKQKTIHEETQKNDIPALIDTRFKKWTAAVQTKWQKDLLRKRRMEITFPKYISQESIHNTLITLYNIIVMHALPEITYPDLQAKLSDCISLPKEWVEVFKTASICMFYQPTALNLRRPGHFKKITLEPYMTNLFHRAFTQENNALMFCFYYLLLSWLNYLLLQDSKQNTIQSLVLSPLHPHFELYYQLPLLLARAEMSWQMVQTFIVFHLVQHIAQPTIKLLVRMYAVYRLMQDAIVTHDPEAGLLWSCETCHVDDACQIYSLFTRYERVRRLCHELYMGTVVATGDSYCLRKEEDEGVVFELYQMALDPEIDPQASLSILKGFKSPLNGAPMHRSTLSYSHPLKHSKAYYDDYCICNNMQLPSYNPIPLESFLSLLEQNLFPPSHPLKFIDRSKICFSIDAILPIFIDPKGLILNTEEVFFIHQ